METLANKPTLNPALKDFWLAPARNRVLYGGRSSSKSWDAAGFIIFLACNYKLRVCCARQFQNKIAESVYTLLKIQIERFGLESQFKILDNSIVNLKTGTEFLFYGLWRSIDEVKSLEGIDILWLEEAHNLTADQWKVLEPTIRKEGSQVWIIFNPKLATDFAYKRFVSKPPPNTVIRKINYDENPFLSQTMIDIIVAAKAADPDEYAHIYEGIPRDDDESVVIKRSWIMAAVDFHKKRSIAPSGRKRIGFDVADSGHDLCAEIYAHGFAAIWSDMWKGGEDELLKSCTRVYASAVEREASITYDSIGVGASAGAKFGEINDARQDGRRVTYSKFNAGAAVFKPESIYGSTQTKNKDMFANLKAQAWWLVADRFRNTFNALHNGTEFDEDELISISADIPNLEQLIDELSTPKRDFDATGKVKVESKKDLAKREVDSPNLADAFIMAFAPGVEPMSISQDTIKQLSRMGSTR
ncbi:PBSX family phage terminase large subunit [Collimonas pratensis]|uniref:PBSX family phage terminase large subunit n=1 Tax=Collimonas pratensis TaxID=279113 RepID=UPI00143CDC24|nr:PBSX family phage terminase large subunit [Collimonas pratensis]NKI68948.1 PBSX family phage terminase large subunit [Collimonas pratensis]